MADGGPSPLCPQGKPDYGQHLTLCSYLGGQSQKLACSWLGKGASLLRQSPQSHWVSGKLKSQGAAGAPPSPAVQIKISVFLTPPSLRELRNKMTSEFCSLLSPLLHFSPKQIVETTPGACQDFLLSLEAYFFFSSRSSRQVQGLSQTMQLSRKGSSFRRQVI